MNDRVFCQDCFFYTMLMTQNSISFVCRVEGIETNIWGEKVGVSCIEKNAYYNCKDYKRSGGGL